MEHSLAIIIPAYKNAFLAEALDAMATQTDQRFTVYVGDDQSPENIKATVEQYQRTLTIEYTRFEQNLGSQSLAGQWSRSIRLSHEPWVWLFSDDDTMEATCVASFYQALEETNSQYDVYRFNTNMIDGQGQLIRHSPDHAPLESTREFVIKRFRFQKISTACEYIFARSAFDRAGGMIEFPLAWSSDDASWVAFTGEKLIYTISGPRANWRWSGVNISSITNQYRQGKVEALFQYLQWVNQRLFTRHEIVEKHVVPVQRNWLYVQLDTFQTYISVAELHRFAQKGNRIWNDGYAKNVYLLLLFNVRLFRKKTYCTLRRITKLLLKDKSNQ